MENKRLTGDVIDEIHEYYTLQELCVICNIDQTTIIALIESGVIETDIDVNEEPSHRFSYRMLRRSQQALKLSKELELDLTNLAFSLDLLEEVQQLRQEVNNMQHMLRRLLA